MGKNILIVNGSPRKGGNTEALADAFAKGAKTKGHAVTRFDAAADIVKGCIACDACWSKGDACVFDDGFRRLAPLIEKTEILVLASPVYWFGLSAQIKSAIDKMYAFTAKSKPMAVTGCVLLLCAEDSDEKVFAGSIGTYQGICDYMQWKQLGMVNVTSVYEKGAIAGNPALARAEALGAGL